MAIAGESFELLELLTKVGDTRIVDIFLAFEHITQLLSLRVWPWYNIPHDSEVKDAVVLYSHWVVTLLNQTGNLYKTAIDILPTRT